MGRAREERLQEACKTIPGRLDNVGFVVMCCERRWCIMCEALARVESMLWGTGECGQYVRGRSSKRQGILGVGDVGWGCKSHVDAT